MAKSFHISLAFSRMLLILDSGHQRFSENVIVWYTFFLTRSFLVMPWEYIGGDMLIFHQKKVNPSSKSRSLPIPGHLGSGLMAPISIFWCVQVLHPKGFHLQRSELLSHWELSSVTCCSCPLKGNSVGGSSPLFLVLSHCCCTAGCHPGSQIPVPF